MVNSAPPPQVTPTPPVACASEHLTGANPNVLHPGLRARAAHIRWPNPGSRKGPAAPSEWSTKAGHGMGPSGHRWREESGNGVESALLGKELGAGLTRKLPGNGRKLLRAVPEKRERERLTTTHTLPGTLLFSSSTPELSLQGLREGPLSTAHLQPHGPPKRVSSAPVRTPCLLARPGGGGGT